MADFLLIFLLVPADLCQCKSMGSYSLHFLIEVPRYKFLVSQKSSVSLRRLYCAEAACIWAKVYQYHGQGAATIAMIIASKKSRTSVSGELGG